LDTIDTKQVNVFVERVLADLRSRGKDLLKRINTNKKLEEADEKELKKIATDNVNMFNG
jgi:F0F1-type ATP synthase alpha subunit